MKTAFIGLDYIVDIMHPTGKIARSAQHAANRQVIQHANTLLEHAKANDWLSVLVKVGFKPGYHEAPAFSPMFGKAKQFGALALGGPGTEFHPDLKASLADMVVEKPRINAFYGTPLEPALRAQEVKQLVVAGVSTAWAVQSLVRDAHDRDYRVVVVEDACAAVSQEEHDASIALLRGIARVVSISELSSIE
ncbi:cysteine hydrolase family protein [Pseudorhodoferax sp. Leaf265]|uniref:cysteine hydrolase family protein n=1 Tax=Pseudorhodoferax sp. Leaf265 TaxID=1736315 RepID=UPI0006FCE067|nr:isochorismatase family cysteine hydrolase [Pseudorhodoferax sp. Leaf265]KQP15987.1 isochorismatase [Pseudorhodoferax sp. Leaf265]